MIRNWHPGPSRNGSNSRRDRWVRATLDFAIGKIAQEVSLIFSHASSLAAERLAEVTRATCFKIARVGGASRPAQFVPSSFELRLPL